MRRASINTFSSKNQTQFELAVKTELLKRGMTVTQLAKKLGFSRTAVSLAINQSVLPTVKDAIASHLGIQLKK
jgi:lambda repressor-like predicted transcriptional regulator